MGFINTDFARDDSSSQPSFSHVYSLSYHKKRQKIKEINHSVWLSHSHKPAHIYVGKCGWAEISFYSHFISNMSLESSLKSPSISFFWASMANDNENINQTRPRRLYSWVFLHAHLHLSLSSQPWVFPDIGPHPTIENMFICKNAFLLTCWTIF